MESCPHTDAKAAIGAVARSHFLANRRFLNFNSLERIECNPDEGGPFPKERGNIQARQGNVCSNNNRFVIRDVDPHSHRTLQGRHSYLTLRPPPGP